MTPTKQQLVIAGLIVFGILFAGFFGMRAIRAIKHIHDGGFGPGKPPPPPSETDVELIRDWMTIPYIAKTYGVPDRMLFKELNIPDKDNQEKSLKELNEEYYPDQNNYVLDEIKKAIIKHRPPLAPIAPAP
jgi:hypothetical protein